MVSSTVTPSPSSSRMASHTRWRLVGSRPVVGSSRKSTGGRVIRLARQVQPPAHAARVALEDPVGGVGQLELGQQLGRPGPGRRAPMSHSSPDQDQVLSPGQEPSRVASWRPRRYGVAPRRGAPPRRSPPPWPGRSRVGPAWSGSAPPWSCRPRSDRAAQDRAGLARRIDTPARAWVSP